MWLVVALLVGAATASEQGVGDGYCATMDMRTWLKSVNPILLTYADALVEYGYENTGALAAEEKADLEEAFVELKIKKPHRRLLLKAAAKVMTEHAEAPQAVRGTIEEQAASPAKEATAAEAKQAAEPFDLSTIIIPDASKGKVYSPPTAEDRERLQQEKPRGGSYKYEGASVWGRARQTLLANKAATLVHVNPDVFVVHDLLSTKECDGLLELFDRRKRTADQPNYCFAQSMFGDLTEYGAKDNGMGDVCVDDAKLGRKIAKEHGEGKRSISRSVMVVKTEDPWADLVGEKVQSEVRHMKSTHYAADPYIPHSLPFPVPLLTLSLMLFLTRMLFPFLRCFPRFPPTLSTHAFLHAASHAVCLCVCVFAGGAGRGPRFPYAAVR
jgi:hypothetical protein